MNNEDKIVEYLARMCAIIIFVVVIAVLLGMCSCTRTMYVPVTSVQHDSIYLHTHSRDSIIVRDSVTIREKGDTVWLTRWRTECRDRIRIDTAYIERRDSVPVPYPVEKPLTYWQKKFMSIGKVSLGVWVGLAIALLIYFLTRKKIRI